MSTKRTPKKQRKLFEHQTPWLIATVLGALATCGLTGALMSGVLGSRQAFRGHAPLNVTMAVIAVLLFMLSGFYLLRKRMFQEEFSLLRASMQSWLWAHIYLALFGTWLIVLHAGYSLLTLEITTGKLALFALFGSILSGLLWRLVYAVVPRRATKSVGNYSTAASVAEAEQLDVEIEKLAAGRSAQFHQLKDYVVKNIASPAEVERQIAGFAPDEATTFRQLVTLADKRRRALGRIHGQKAYVRLLQSWRLLHVPVTLGFMLLVPLHVVFAYRLPARIVPPGAVDGSALGAFERSEECANCHAAIVKQWRGSMHAQAMFRATMVAQTNQDLKTTLKGTQGPDPKDLCINCHGPVGAALSGQSELPLAATGLFADQELLMEGISCVACHQYNGKSFPGKAALSQFKDGYRPGRTYFGPHDDPVPNSFHQSQGSPLFREPGELCQNCHSVNYDLNGDGKIEKGKDLVLQTIFEEWQYYKKQGNGAGCVDCHMPVSESKRSAEAAWIPFEQDYEGPARQVREHTFIGADHRIDIPEAEDPHAEARRRLLQSAASVSIEPQSLVAQGNTLAFKVTVANSGTGHRLPGGFAFVRQMWLEAVVKSATGEVLASSGTVQSPEHDVCDPGMFTGLSQSILPFTLGCAEPDPLLANFQAVLLDHIEAAKTPDGSPDIDALGHPRLAAKEGAQETFLQHFTSGPVARLRGIDNKPNPPLDPGEARTLGYAFDLGARIGEAREVQVRLLFRAFAPYFLRALGKNQAPNEVPVAPMVKNLRVDTVASATARLGEAN